MLSLCRRRFRVPAGGLADINAEINMEGRAFIRQSGTAGIVVRGGGGHSFGIGQTAPA
jgi:hypothetical protein